MLTIRKHNDDNKKILNRQIYTRKQKRENSLNELQLNELDKKMEDINKRIGGFYSLI